MERLEIEREVARFEQEIPIERAWTPPSSWYAAPQMYEFEKGAVLTKTWQPLVRVAEVDRPGAYVSGTFAGEPWVVVRGQDNVLRAFSNTCRHKGREVVQGSGCADELVCGYHAWSYGCDGALKSAPRMAGIEAFDRAEMALPELALEVWGPWAFVNFDSQAAPLAPRLTELTRRLDATQWERLAFVERTSWEIACNWKVYVDNYLDGGYHIPHMHPTLDAQLDMQSYRTELFEEFSIQTSDPAGSQDDRVAFDAGARIGDAAHYAWIYPNFMLNRYGPCLDTNYVVPVGPDACRVDYEFYFLETDGTDADAFIRESIEQSAVTQREDIAICESVQVGLHSTSYERGRYAPRVEIGEHHFHRLLAAQYRHALSGMLAVK